MNEKVSAASVLDEARDFATSPTAVVQLFPLSAGRLAGRGLNCETGYVVPQHLQRIGAARFQRMSLIPLPRGNLWRGGDA